MQRTFRSTALASAFTAMVGAISVACGPGVPSNNDDTVPGTHDNTVAPLGEGEGEGEGGRTPVGEGEGEGAPVGEGEGEGEGGLVGEGEGEGEGAPPALTCTSGHHWFLGDLHSSLMHPGLSCIACHATHSGAPHYFAAGTVMGALHDDDNCHGATAVTVRVTGDDGVVHTATTNSNGNFYFDGPIPTPYRAEIEKNGHITAMQESQTNGDCMACHTALGTNGASGRIVP